MVMEMKGSTASTLRIDHRSMCGSGRFPRMSMPAPTWRVLDADLVVLGAVAEALAWG